VCTRTPVKRGAVTVDVVGVLRLLKISVLCSCLGAIGCASARQPFTQEHVEMREYKPLSVPAATTVRERWEKLQRLAASEAWRLQSFDETRGLMIAARISKDTPEIRERVRVVLRPAESEIAVQTEVFEDGEWDARELTCGPYGYSRETEIAMKLER
jgi:hypothetical protein